MDIKQFEEGLTEYIINEGFFAKSKHLLIDKNKLIILKEFNNLIIYKNSIKKEFFNIFSTNSIEKVEILLELMILNFNKFIYENGREKKFDLKAGNDLNRYWDLFKISGLYNMVLRNQINDFVSFYSGIVMGKSTNSRKNISGKIMEQKVKEKLALFSNELHFELFQQKKISDRAINVSQEILKNVNNTVLNKKFDFIIKQKNKLILIETNLYNTNGSKLNETAKSYTLLFNEINNNKNLKFLWITDGKGWKASRNQLKDAIQKIKNVLNLKTLTKQSITKILDQKNQD